jgi:hypothetical protein
MRPFDPSTCADYKEISVDAGNDYNALLDGAPTQAAINENPYQNILKDDKAEQKTLLQQSMYVASPLDPDRQAKILQLATEMKMPANLVERNYDELQKKKALQTTDYNDLVENSPGTAQFLADPQNAAIAKDDLQNLRNVEDSVKDYGAFTSLWRSLNVGSAQLLASVARLPALVNDVGLLPVNLGFKYLYNQPGSQLKSPDWLINNPLAVHYDNEAKAWDTPDLHEDVVKNIAGGNYSKAGRGLLSQFVSNSPNQAALLLLAVYGLPVAGLVGAGATQASGTLKNSNDAGVDPASATINAITQGTLEAGFENIGTFGVLHHWESAIARSFGKQTSREVFKEVGKSLAYSALAEGNEEFWTQIGQDFSDYVSGVNPDALDGMLSRAANAGLAGSFAGVVGTAPAGATHSIQQHVQQKESAMARDFFLSFGKSAEATKLRERLPEKQREFVEKVTQGTGVENVYIPVEAMETYFQTKGIPPAQIAQEIGISKEYNEAKDSGTDVKIPLSTMAEKLVGTEHYNALADDIKFNPSAMTVNEAKAEAEKVRTDVQQADAEAQSAKENQASQESAALFEESARHVRENIKSQLVETGMLPADADKQALLYQEAFKSLGAKSGKDPLQLFEQYGLRIQKQNQSAQPNEQVFNQAMRPGEVEQTTVPHPSEVKIAQPLETVPVDLSQDRGQLTKQVLDLAQKGNFINAQTGLTINVSGQTIRKSVDQAEKFIRNKSNRAYQTHLEVAQHLGELLQNAVFHTQSGDNKGRSTQWLYLFAPLQLNGKEQLVKLEVKKNRDQYTLHNYTVLEQPGGGEAKTSDIAQSDTSVPARSTLPIDEFMARVKSARDAKTFFQSPQQATAVVASAPAFYLKSTQLLEQKMGNSATVEQVKAILKDVKEEERKWSGLDDFLKGKEKVSKPELLEFLRANQLQIQEVTKGENKAADRSDNTAAELVPVNTDQAIYAWATGNVIMGQRAGELGHTALTSSASIIGFQGQLFKVPGTDTNADRSTQPKVFGKYTLPGGENYREVLFTIPRSQRGKTPRWLLLCHYGENNAVKTRRRDKLSWFHARHSTGTRSAAETFVERRQVSVPIITAPPISMSRTFSRTHVSMIVWMQRASAFSSSKKFNLTGIKPDGRSDINLRRLGRERSIEKELNAFEKQLLDKYRGRSVSPISTKIGLSEIASFRYQLKSKNESEACSRVQ